MATEASSEKVFGGYQKVFTVHSKELGGKTTFGVFLPPKVEHKEECPVLYYLSGLTCTEANFIQKAGFQRYAAELGVIVVNPDTSPRGAGVEGEDDSYDLGTGAGFYVDATTAKWKKHYRMYSFVVKELPEIIKSTIPEANIEKCGIFGHSMGGHGALSIYLKNADKYKSCSAFAPICNPVNCAWGQKAFSAYLGEDKSSWSEYDSCELINNLSGEDVKLVNPILIDQGTADSFLGDQLKPESLKAAADRKSIMVNLRMQEGYAHGYPFISTFVEDHLRHHSAYLN